MEFIEAADEGLHQVNNSIGEFGWPARAGVSYGEGWSDWFGWIGDSGLSHRGGMGERATNITGRG